MISTFNYQLSTLNCFPSFRFLDHGLFAHDDDHAALRNVMARAIGFEVVADFGALGDCDVTVDDGVADAGVAADVHMIDQDGIFHFAVAVDAHVVAHHGALHAAARNDRTAGNDGIQRRTHALGVGENGLHGRILVHPGAQRPGLIIEI